MRLVTLLLCPILATGCARTAEPQPVTTFEQLAKDSLAPLEGRVVLPGLRQEVQVLRDEWGVPHI
jgi:acyl-homoserine lactone acylase PvdQ